MSHALLMEVRLYRPVAFADTVLAHDVQDAHADGVSIPAASGQASQAHAGKHPALRAASCAGLHSQSTVYGAALAVVEVLHNGEQGAELVMQTEERRHVCHNKPSKHDSHLVWCSSTVSAPST